MTYSTQAEFQNLASTGGAQAVFDYAKNNGMSLDQLAKIGGVSTQDMANLAQANGINTGMLSQIGYVPPTVPVTTTPKAYTGNATDKPIYSPFTGQLMQPGTKEYNDFVTSNTAELVATGHDPAQFAATGGRNAPTFTQSMDLSSPLSSAFAANNVNGGGQDWYAGIGGWNGYVNGMMTDPNYLNKILDPGTAAIYQQQNSVAAGRPVYDPQTGTYKQPSGNAINPAFVYSNNMGGVLNTPITEYTPTGTATNGVSGTANNLNLTSNNGIPAVNLMNNTVGGSSYHQGLSGFDATTDTTRGQVNSILNNDSEISQQAKTAALQQMNARGLLNSSIANTAGLSSVINNALSIGDPTANQYQKAKLTTDQLGQQMDLALLDAATRERIAQLSSATSMSQSTLGNYQQIASQTNSYINQILQSPSLTPEAKQQAINSALLYHDQYLQFQDGITGLNLTGMIQYS